MKIPFRQALESRILLADGAMGTMLYSKGIFINTCFDELNLTRRTLIEEIHKEYLAAGAEIIETNTFGANRFKLSAFGIENKVTEINKAGAAIADGAARGNAYIAGSIGPLGKPLRPLGIISREQAKDAFREQIQALAPHVDLLIFETIHSLEEMKIAIEAARTITDKPIISQMTFSDERQTPMGESLEQAARELSGTDIDSIGLNCSIGPQPMLEILEKLRGLTDKYISIQPNAGTPRMVEGRFIYLTSPEYMAEYAKRFIQSGASVVGGCCGTTPQHIKAMRSAVLALQPVHMQVKENIQIQNDVRTLPATAFHERSRLGSNLGRKFFLSVEIDPPKGLDPGKSLEAARLMMDNGVDAINIADGPRASARMSPMALASLMEKNIGIETILHYCCRDRNLLGMQSDLIGAHALGLRNLLIITGDPPKLGDYPDATAVYDVDSIGLVRIVNNMNHGLDVGSNPLKGTTGFTIGIGANPGAIDLETEIKRFFQKIDAGAEFVLTQPVYEPSLLENFLELTRGAEIPILVGILPLTSFKNAEFLHNEVPGMQIPPAVLEKMRKAPGGEKARQMGVSISRDALKGCMSFPRVKGAYIMPPFGRYDAVLQIIKDL